MLQFVSFTNSQSIIWYFTLEMMPLIIHAFLIVYLFHFTKVKPNFYILYLCDLNSCILIGLSFTP